MLFKLLTKFDQCLPLPTLSAHCDIPCKIYDPISAQLAVMTMLRLVDLLDELEQKGQDSANDKAQFIRLVNEKEEHGNKVKHEITIIWGDYFKQPQLQQFPEIHELTHQIMLATSQAKQHINREVTLQLLSKVNRFAKIFWATKGVETFVANAPYPPLEQLVYPQLTASC